MEARALSDLKVVELGHFIAVPYCTKLLADLGAEVVKIESPGGGDPARSAGPFLNDVPHPDRSGLFLYLNTNKKSITLDVTTATGSRIFKELLRDADILVEDNLPSEAKRLGFDYDSLCEVDSRLIVTSITPFGQTGPHSDFKGSDLIANHMSGLSFWTPWKVTDASQEPLRAGGKQGDFVAGTTAAVGTMLAVFSRSLNGAGQHVDISAQEALASFMRMEVASYTHDFAGNFQLMNASRVSQIGYGLVGIFPCKDGYVSIGTREQYQWEAFADLLGRKDFAEDPRFADGMSRREHWHLIEPVLLEWTMRHTRDEIFRQAQARRVPIFPCNTTEEALQSAQIQDRDYFVDVAHPETGNLTYPGAPYKLSGTPWRVVQPAPRLGEHNEEIFCARLGYHKENLVKMREAGLI